MQEGWQVATFALISAAEDTNATEKTRAKHALLHDIFCVGCCLLVHGSPSEHVRIHPLLDQLLDGAGLLCLFIHSLHHYSISPVPHLWRWASIGAIPHRVLHVVVSG
jgi:hypothetical protein